MDKKAEISDFLSSRRARITPEQTGLPAWAGNRRVPGLRRENSYDHGLTELVGELSTRSEVFRQLWARHDVRLHRTGTKRFHHPLVGELTLAYEGLEIAADSGLRLNAYVAEPDTASAEAFSLLASWANAPITAKE